MNKEEFVAGYSARFGISLDELSKHNVVLSCACKDELCEGWAMIPNDVDSVMAHIKLYPPDRGGGSTMRCGHWCAFSPHDGCTIDRPN